MFGISQILGCCFDQSAIPPPDFPGQKRVNVSCSGSISMSSDNSESVDIREGYTLCFPVPFGMSLYYPGHQLQWNAGINNKSQQLTRTLVGTYSSGIAYYSYSAPGTFVEDKSASYNFNQPSLINVGLIQSEGPYFAQDFFCGIASYPLYREVFDTPQTTVTNVSPSSFSPAFTWLGVAQKSLPGIRLKLKTGATPAGFWYYSVTNGVLKIFNDDPTNPKSESFSGTLNQVATQINSSTVSTWVDSRSSSFNRSGEQAGVIPTGANPLTYVFTGNDPSTMLKDAPQTQIIGSCSEPGAPSGWTTSVKVAIYLRGEILPPRGIVQISGFAKNETNNSDAPFFINEYSATNPNIGTFENTEQGALQFLTTQYHFLPGPATPSNSTVDPTDVGWGPKFVYEDFAENVLNIEFGVSGLSLFSSYRRFLSSITITSSSYNYSKSYTPSQYKPNSNEIQSNPYYSQVSIGSCPWVWVEGVSNPNTGQLCTQLPGWGQGCPIFATGELVSCTAAGDCNPPCLNAGWSGPGNCGLSCDVFFCQGSSCLSWDPSPCGGQFFCGSGFVTFVEAGELQVRYPPLLSLVKSQTSLGLKFT